MKPTLDEIRDAAEANARLFAKGTPIRILADYVLEQFQIADELSKAIGEPKEDKPMDELKPEVQVALKRYHAGGLMMADCRVLADAFAAEHSPPEPELRPGVYRGEFKGESLWLIVREADDDKCRYYVVGDNDDAWEHRLLAGITGIVPVDDAWRKWATKEHETSNPYIRLTVSQILRDGRWKAVAAELDELLKETP